MSFDTPAKDTHYACEIVLPPGLPKTWRQPAHYVIGAVNRKFADDAAYLHAIDFTESVMFIASEQGVCDKIQALAKSLVDRPASYTFRLLLEGVSPLNDEGAPDQTGRRNTQARVYEQERQRTLWACRPCGAQARARLSSRIATSRFEAMAATSGPQCAFSTHLITGSHSTGRLIGRVSRQVMAERRLGDSASSRHGIPSPAGTFPGENTSEEPVAGSCTTTQKWRLVTTLVLQLWRSRLLMRAVAAAAA